MVEKVNFYLERTTLHGFSYISVRRNFAERSFWILSLIISLICCLLLLYQLIVKVENNPIVVYRADTAVHIRDIPFPAISVCTEPMLQDSYVRFASLLTNDTASYPFNLSVCPYGGECYIPLVDRTDIDFFMQRKLVFVSTWMNRQKIKPNVTISSQGWCYTFNGVNDDELYHLPEVADYFRYQKLKQTSGLERTQLNYTSTSPLYTGKKDAGFHGIFESSANMYFKYGYDYRIFLARNWRLHTFVHSPYELPDMRHRNFILKNFDRCQLMITAQIDVTEGEILELDVDDRQCYVEGERSLLYFRKYTAINCLKECESSFILKKCNCVPYFFINNNASKICTESQLECFNVEYEKFQADFESSCKCYPPCHELRYDVLMQKRETVWQMRAKYFNNPGMIQANFKDDQFYPQNRRKYFTMIDWFSFVGGILGLFFGFSFLSAFEIMFHFCWGFSRSKRNSMNQTHFNRNLKYRKQLKSIGNYFKDFMNSSSIHSLSYISDKKLSLYEKISWTISLIISILGCSFMILKLREKISIDVISITNGDRLLNITEIPFPAISVIRPFPHLADTEIATKLRLEINFFKPYESYDEFLLHRLIIYIGRNDITEARSKIATFPYKNISEYSQRIVPIIKRFSAVQYRAWLKLLWDQNFKVPDVDILTKTGAGSSFNLIEMDKMFHTERISEDFFYKHKMSFKTGTIMKNSSFPWTSDYKNIELTMENNMDHIWPYISFHSPFEYPFMLSIDSKNMIEMMKDQNIDVLVTPEILTTDNDFNNLPLIDRKCYMDGERKLKFFKIYTQGNCEIECMSEKLLNACNCVPFYIIRSNNTKVCEIQDYFCIDQVQYDILYEDDPWNYCKCLQPCNLISYSFEYIETKFRILPTYGRVRIRFKNNEFSSMQRVRQFTVVDFLSYIGGLLGLFAGVSVLSLFEIFYFFTLRLVMEFFRVKREMRRVRHNNIMIVQPRNVTDDLKSGILI